MKIVALDSLRTVCVTTVPMDTWPMIASLVLTVPTARPDACDSYQGHQRKNLLLRRRRPWHLHPKWLASYTVFSIRWTWPYPSCHLFILSISTSWMFLVVVNIAIMGFPKAYKVFTVSKPKYFTKGNFPSEQFPSSWSYTVQTSVYQANYFFYAYWELGSNNIDDKS